MRFSVAWGDHPSAEPPPPERCTSCGRVRDRFTLCIATQHETPGCSEKKQSGRRTDAVSRPAEAPIGNGPDGRGPSQDDAIPALATTAPPWDTADEAR